MKKQLLFESIVKTFTKENIRYKKRKTETIIKYYLRLWCCINIIYLLLKQSEILFISLTIEIIITLFFLIVFLTITGYHLSLESKSETPFFKKYKKIVLTNNIGTLHQALTIRIQKNNLDNNNINVYNLLKSIFIFFFGFYFSNYTAEIKLTADNLIVVSLFTFFVVLSSTLIVEMFKLAFNKTNLKYVCLLEEIEEYNFKQMQNKSLMFKILGMIKEQFIS